MRRPVALLVLVVSGVLIAPAGAGARSYSGHVLAPNGGKISFDVRVRNGKPKSVRHVAYSALKERCADDAATFVSGFFLGSSGVDGDGRFEFHAGSDRFTGRLGAHRKARGEVVVHFDHPFHGPCVNAEHDWRTAAS